MELSLVTTPKSTFRKVIFPGHGKFQVSELKLKTPARLNYVSHLISSPSISKSTSVYSLTSDYEYRRHVARVACFIEPQDNIFIASRQYLN